MRNAIRHMLTGFRTTRRSSGRLRHTPPVRDPVVSLGWGYFDWHAVATLATLFMTLVIQRAEHRDTQALQGKLDELLRVQPQARNELTRLDEKEPEEIEKWRARETEE